MKTHALVALGLSALLVAATQATPLLNEIHANPPGAEDPKFQYFEILTVDAQGKPQAETLNNVSLVVVDGNGNSSGGVTMALNLNGKKTGSNGLLLIGAGFSKTQPFAGVATETEVLDLASVKVANSEAEIGPKSGLTVLLATNFTGKPTDDLDSNDRGTFTRSPWNTILDSIAFGEKAYAAKITATDAAFAPDNLGRVQGNVAASQGAAWYGGKLNNTSGGTSLSYDQSFFGAFTGAATPGQANLAPPSENPIRINEVMVNPTARVGDTNFEYIELVSTNGTVASTADLWLLVVDSHNDGGVVGEVERAFNLTGQATGINGLMLIGNNYTRANNPWNSLVEKETEVFEPTGLTDNDIGDNDGFTLLLVKKFTGAAKTDTSPGTDLDSNNDGVIDARPWDASVGQAGVLDSVGFAQLAPTAAGTVATVLSKTFALVDFAQNTAAASYVPDVVFRKPGDNAANSAAAWAGGELAGKGVTGIGFDGDRVFGGYRGVATPGRKNVASTPAQELVLINEVHVDPNANPDATAEFIELFSPNRAITAMNDLELILVDMSGSQRGTIGSVVDINGYSTGNNGLMLIGDNYDDSPPTAYDVPKATDREDPEGFDGGDVGSKDNQSLAVLLVQGFTGVQGQDLDTNDDGIFDLTPWSSVMDSVGFGTGLKQTQNFANLNEKGFIPASISRIPGNLTQNDAGAWLGGSLLATDTASLAYDKFFGPYKAEASPGRANLAAPRSSGLILINEAHVNPPAGDDNYEYVEVIAVGGGRQSAHLLSLVLLDGTGDKVGEVLELWHLDGMATGTDGILTLGNRYAPSASTGSLADITQSYWDRSLFPGQNATTPYGDGVNTKVSAVGYPSGFGSGALGDNAVFNLLLVEGFTGALGDDLDTNDDSALDARPWKQERGDRGILDSVGFRNWQTTQYEGRLYTLADLSQKVFTPDNLSRQRGKLTANQAAAWYGGDIAGDTPEGVTYGPNFVGLKAAATPGAINAGEASSDAADDDNDGVSNGTEKLAGTNPNDPSDYLRMTSAARTGSGVALAWRAVAGKSYNVEYSDNLKGDWQTITNTAVSAGQFTDTDATRTSKGKGFYRVRVAQ